ncbi:hypothetical protein [Zooshikella ganghwensis]|uniref:Tail fiber assembly protein n=1 Tax=Zooshikella ganghwensis TaxID=202772 RepID=A0A4P9VJA5_9GAMM|nr:hypothetical protein [Zooshikella ganghwensis]RDH43348.1 hypothetical protein B9G39_07810 [Zooshikella ganghwensis]
MELKNLKLYKPEIANPNTLYLCDDLDNDWYDSQIKFSRDTLKIVYDHKGVIVSHSEDVSSLWPVHMSVAEVETAQVPKGFFDKSEGQWVWDGSLISQKMVSLEEIKVKAREIRDNLKAQIDKMFSPGFTINDILLTDIQKDELIKYSLSLSKWPKEDKWPNVKLPKPPKWTKPFLKVSKWPEK